jgi:SAM-dependent methyltransferase
MVFRARLFRVYHAMRAAITPSLRYSQEIYEETLTPLVRGARWLDLGCGHRVLPTWRETQEHALVAASRFAAGIDYDLPSLLKHRSFSLRTRGDLCRLPFAAESFDLASANMVLEHLDKPVAMFQEVRRVLAPGGSFIFHTPNLHGYATIGARLLPQRSKVALADVLEGRSAEDVFPTHYRANDIGHIESLAREAGLEVVMLRLIATDAVFALVPPLALLELLWIRLLLTHRFQRLRPNLIGILRRPCDV